MRKLLHKIAKSLVNIFSRNKLLFRLFNLLYEKSSDKICWYLEKYINPPKFDFKWHIYLPNNKQIIYPYKAGDPYFSFHLPLSYKRNDFLIRKIEVLIDEIYPDEIVYFDIGANLGLRSLYFAAMNREVFMFEPNTNLKKFTERIISENKLNNLTLINNLVGSADGEFYDFHLSTSSYCSSVFSDVLSGDSIDSIINLPTITIDKFIADNRLENKVKIVKIDVEGFEFDVVKGAMKLFSSEGVTLIIEVLQNSKGRSEIFELFHRMDFSIYVIDTKIGRLVKCLDGFSDNFIDYLVTKNSMVINSLKEKKLL